MPLERLQKILAQAGLASRRGAEKLILSGRIALNGQVVTELGQKADPSLDRLTIDGQAVALNPRLAHFMFHKPSGYLTTLADPQGRPTIKPFLDRLGQRVYPVGRLDLDVSGILILTNDGELARRLMHPSYEVPKVYRVKVAERLDQRALDLLSGGRLLIGDQPAAPAKARIVKTGPDQGWLELILTEGRHRQVKRMCSAVGHPVVVLKRVAYGDIKLDPQLAPGQIRSLTPKEILTLKSKVALDRDQLEGPKTALDGVSHRGPKRAHNNYPPKLPRKG
ncbi:MAG: rRNA pseudouridine synthase [Deltaproteobacteria bacterium]|jgi:23S rRNA pseudouridine2605 synthase|nr:rRNA pseudouridine synthase [Deltaproteobacteria bacterium]